MATWMCVKLVTGTCYAKRKKDVVRDCCPGVSVYGERFLHGGKNFRSRIGETAAPAAGVTSRAGAVMRQIVADCIESLHCCRDATGRLLAIRGFPRPDGDKWAKMTCINHLARILQSDL